MGDKVDAGVRLQALQARVQAFSYCIQSEGRRCARSTDQRTRRGDTGRGLCCRLSEARDFDDVRRGFCGTEKTRHRVF